MLEGKICIVTGGTRGIGKRTAQIFAQNGAIVYALGTHKENQNWIEMWNQEHRGHIYPLICDVADEETVRTTVLQVRNERGRIDVLVNNAGVEYNELIGMIQKEHMKSMFKVNVFGTIYMSQTVSRVMRRQLSGSIINISSVVGRYGNPGQSVYAATKAAVIAFTKSAAKELGAYNVRVNAVAPGLTQTEMLRGVDSEYLQKRVDKIAFGRPARPEDIANVCLFLASDLSSYVSGQVLGVDGCTSL